MEAHVQSHVMLNMVLIEFSIDILHPVVLEINIGAVTCDFQHRVNLTSVASDEPVQPPV